MRRAITAVTMAAAVGGCLWISSATAATTLIYADYLAPKHPTNQALQEYFDATEKDSKGAIKWETHYGSSLLGPKDIPAGVRDGVADAGYFVGVYVPSELPVDNYIGDFSMLNDDAVAMTAVINELILLDCKECAQEYEKSFKTKFLGTYATSDYVYQCKDHLQSLADFRGKRLRGFAAWTDLIRKIGAVPVSVSSTEIYEALDRGIIDCGMYYISAQKTNSLSEVAPNVLLDSLGGYMGGSMINLRLDKWEKLSIDERKLLVRHLPRLVAKIATDQVANDEAVRKEMEAKGAKFFHADAALGKIIKDFRSDYVKTKAVDRGKQRGVKDPQQIADQILKLRAKWDDLLAKNGRDEATVERLLWEQIFSKISIQ